jgi:hypothetical protein
LDFFDRVGVGPRPRRTAEGRGEVVPSIRYTFSLVADPNDCDRELVEVDALTPGRR